MTDILTDNASDSSYWQHEANWTDRWHRNSLPTDVDYAIIGGGYSGLATAIQIQTLCPNAKTVVLEAERVGYGASGRNAGFISPVAAPIWLLGADRSAEQAWAVAHLNKEAHRVANWLSSTMADTEINKTNLCIEATSRLTAGGLREFARALDVSGLSYRLTDSRVHPGHPCLQMSGYTLHPYKLVSALAEHAINSGVTIFERTRVRGIKAMPQGAHVLLDGGELPASKIIVCTNAYTNFDVGERIGALALHSFMVASAPLSPRASESLIRDGDFVVELSAIQPYHRMHRNRVLYGGMDKVIPPSGGDFAVPKAQRQRIQKQMSTSFPHHEILPIAESWSGKFHATATGLPIIRQSAANSAVILNVGYGGTGVVLSLIGSRLSAMLATDFRFAAQDDVRLLTLFQKTKLPLRGSVRTLSRLIRRIVKS